MPPNRHRQEISSGKYHYSCVQLCPPALTALLATSIGVTWQGGFQMSKGVSGCAQALHSHWQIENQTVRGVSQRRCTSEYCPWGMCPLLPHPCQWCKGWTAPAILQAES